MQALILAGGKGTRLRERLGGLPKPLVDICGVPLLERQIQSLIRYGFQEIIILVNHEADKIIEFCDSKTFGGIKITCIDDGQPRGTAGAAIAVFDNLSEEFLVVYGDTMFDVDLLRFYRFHLESRRSAATLFLHPNDHPGDSDLVEIDECGEVKQFLSYPHDPARYYPNLVNAALYWVRKSFLANWRDSPTPFDFGKDLFPAMLLRGIQLRGYVSPEYIKDAGTPSRLDKVCADLISGKIERSSLRHSQSAIFLDRDGTINQEAGHLKSPEQFELLPGVDAAIRKINQSDYRCCVITNQPVLARGECSVESLREIHHKMDTLLGKSGAYIDRVYYCPHHPDTGYRGEIPELKVNCSCRKPNTGMIEQAVNDLNIDCSKSWMIGDSSADILLARRAGLKSILVESGNAGMDYKFWCLPDFVVPDLPAAVDFILEKFDQLVSRFHSVVELIAPGSIVLIGGRSRCGKSTFAGILKYALQLEEKNVHVLQLDRWLKSEDQRDSGVLGRYDLLAVNDLVSARLRERGNKQRVILPGYDKLKRQRIDAVEELQLATGDIVIIEGTVALAIAPRRSIAITRFHVETDEELRHQRVLNEYLLRGYRRNEAEAIYAQRMADEIPFIDSFSGAAQKITIL